MTGEQWSGSDDHPALHPLSQVLWPVQVVLQRCLVLRSGGLCSDGSTVHGNIVTTESGEEVEGEEVGAGVDWEGAETSFLSPDQWLSTRQRSRGNWSTAGSRSRQLQLIHVIPWEICDTDQYNIVIESNSAPVVTTIPGNSDLHPPLSADHTESVDIIQFSCIVNISQ